MKSKLKKAIKRFVIVIVTLIMLPLLAFGTFLLTVPISRPNKMVRNYVLRQLPKGTSWSDSIEIIDDKKWIIEESYVDCGLRINASERAIFASDDEMRNGVSDNKNIRIVGAKSMLVFLGEFNAPFNTAVSAYLAFDDNDQLVEVVIRRDIDAP